MTLTLTLFTFVEILCPYTMPSLIIKWYYSQFWTRWHSSHLLSTLYKYLEQSSNESLILGIFIWQTSQNYPYIKISQRINPYSLGVFSMIRFIFLILGQVYLFGVFCRFLNRICKYALTSRVWGRTQLQTTWKIQSAQQKLLKCTSWT